MSTIHEMESLKTYLKATWMAGDYGHCAKYLEGGAEAFIARLALTPGMQLLDVACGSGNLAIPAAHTGATVTGVDIATNLLAQGRMRAKSAGLTIQFDEGDAEDLPYINEIFDPVVSMFGAIFAPCPECVASELLRVCCPGGRIAMANWTPTGFTGQMFKVMDVHVPPSPLMPSPLGWGDEVMVGEWLGRDIIDLQFTKRFYTFKYPFNPAEVVEFFRLYHGPVKRLFASASLDGDQQAALRSELEQLWSEHNRATDGTTHVEGEYLEVIARRS